MDWKLVSAELILRRRIFNVWQQRRRSPRTGREHDFDVLETSDWVNVVPVTPDRRVILVRQFRHGIGQTTLEVPAGLIDPEDASPSHAGARELREETGYGAADLIPLAVVHPNPALQNNRCHIFLARDARRVGEVQWDGTEEIAVELVPVAEIGARIDSGEISHALAVTALLLALPRL
jgi:ADP-ribose pyrophosphatase